MVGPLRFYPPYTNGLVVHANFREKVDFCFVVRGVYPPYTLSGPTTKKTLFCVCLPLALIRFRGLRRRKKTHRCIIIKIKKTDVSAKGGGGVNPPCPLKNYSTEC